jgi:hypothetical protein
VDYNPRRKVEEVLVSRSDIPRLLAQSLRAIGTAARLAPIPGLSQPAQMQFPSLRAHKSRALASAVFGKVVCRVGLPREGQAPASCQHHGYSSTM